MIKVIAIDCGGVYFHWDQKTYDRELEKLVNAPHRLVKKAQQQYIHALHVGKITEKRYWHSFCKIIGKEIHHKKLRNIGMRQFTPNKPVVQLMKNLRKTYTLALVANQTPMLDDIDKKYDFYKNFDLNFSSHKVKLRKPGREILELLMKRTKTRPAEIVFIDDRKRNTDAYKKLGIKTILFKNSKQLKKKLMTFGISA